MTTPTLTITADDVTEGVYTGSVSLDGYDGNVWISPGLGTVLFRGNVRVSGNLVIGSLIAGDGTTISVGGSIVVGGYISGGHSIISGRGIYAGRSIDAGEIIYAGSNHTITCDRLVGGKVVSGRLVERSAQEEEPS